MSAAGRTVEVEVDRLSGWVHRFGARHGDLSVDLAADNEAAERLVITAADGTEASIAVPYGPLPASSSRDADALVHALHRHVDRTRTVGVLLVRRGGWAAGVVHDGRLVSAAVGSGYVQGRTKAGGWSQQRYARRRQQQAQQVYRRATDGAVEVLLPHRNTLDALVAGGDRTGVATVLGDPRLGGLAGLVESRFLAVADPRRTVLDDVVRRLRTVVVTLDDLA